MNEPLFDKKSLYGNPADGAAPSARRIGRTSKPLLISDVVVDGLLQGMAAGVVMLLSFLLLGALAGYSPSFLLIALGATEDATPEQGLLVHLAISAIYGVVWSLLVALALRRVWGRATPAQWELFGVLFGCGTWLIAEVALVAIAGVSLLPWYALLIAHALYGGTLGLLQARRTRRSMLTS